MSLSPDSPTQPIIFAGLPTINALLGIFFVTTDPEPIKQYSPNSIPQTIVALAPIVAPFFINVFE